MRRFVDSHLHIWDTTINPEWYDFPKPGDEGATMLGWQRELPLRFMFEDHQAAMAPVWLDKAVHVMAVTMPNDAMGEALWLDKVADETGLPNAIIGAVDIEQPITKILDMLDRCMDSNRFKGIRLRQSLDYATALGSQILAGLAARGLLFDVMGHPGQGIAEATAASRRHSDLRFVLEHTGWPLKTRGDSDYFKFWQAEIAEFAEVETNCIKLSGLGMSYHCTDPESFAAHWEYCIEVFGIDRCMFGSNFPIDANYGSFAGLFAIFEAVAERFSADEQDALFATNAERIYRI